MKYASFLILCCFITNLVFAQQNEGTKRKNPVTVGFMVGPALVHTQQASNAPYYNNYYSPNYDGVDNTSFCLAFTAEEYINRARRSLYFSVGERLTSTYFQTNNYYNYALYPGYPYYTTSSMNHMLIGSLAVSAGLNWDIIKGKNAAFTAQLAAVPMVEAGNFKGNYQPNAAGELYLGGTFMKKLSVGLRASHRFGTYEYDVAPYISDVYTVTQLNFDIRFRINGGGGNGHGMHHRER